MNTNFFFSIKKNTLAMRMNIQMENKLKWTPTFWRIINDLEMMFNQTELLRIFFCSLHYHIYHQLFWCSKIFLDHRIVVKCHSCKLINNYLKSPKIICHNNYMQILAEIKKKWSNYNKGLIEAEKLSYLFSILKPNFSECLYKIKKVSNFSKTWRKERN